MHVAARFGQLEILEELCLRGGNINCIDKVTMTHFEIHALIDTCLDQWNDFSIYCVRRRQAFNSKKFDC